MKKAENLADKIEKFSKKSETKEAYAERVFKTLDRAFHDTGKDSITIDTSEGTVRFTKDPSSGSINMYVNDKRVAPEDIVSKIAEIDHVGEEDVKKTVGDVLSEETVRGAGKYLARRGLEATLKAAKKQSEEAKNTANVIMHSLMQMLMMAKIR